MEVLSEGSSSPLRLNKKQLFFNLLYVILIVGLLIFMLWIVKFMKSEATQCLKDPLNYFESQQEGAFCSCMKDGIFYKRSGVDEIVAPQINFRLDE